MFSPLLTLLLPPLLLPLPGLQPEPDKPAPDAIAQNSTPGEGMWPTPQMIDGLLSRWADETALKYELDDGQTARCRDVVTKRWTTFLRQNRPALQPLLNQYIEARLALQPPEPESVRRWAEQAMPVFQDFQRQMRETQVELSAILTLTQRTRLRLENIKINTGLQLFQTRLEAWQQGQFAQNDWWDSPPRQRRENLQAKQDPRRRNTLAPSKAKTRIDGEFLRWDYFVARFADKYKLDDSQREAAYSILRECKQKALTHRDRYRARLERLEKSIALSDKLGDRLPDDLRAEAVAMYGPIDALFVELKTRLEQIPTTAQTEALNATQQPQSPRK